MCVAIAFFSLSRSYQLYEYVEAFGWSQIFKVLLKIGKPNFISDNDNNAAQTAFLDIRWNLMILL